MTASYPELGSLLAGRYKLLRIIGEGGMGIVYEALHTLTEKRVAVKWLHASVASHPEARQRLAREALATCRVSHPNVIDVYDVVQEDGAVFLVMELLEGERLEDLLQRGDTSLPRLVSLLLPAMKGVAEAHRHGVIHRDIHPANIFLARRGGSERVTPKVLDFGISKLGGDAGPALTQAGTTLGTPCYMSYEQLCNARDVDARTDVYSFAVILYRASTGRPPFEAESFTQLAIKIGSATPVPPKELRSDLPTSLERLILWAMARERDDRIDSMETFIRELEPFASEHTYRALMSEPARPVPDAIAQRASSSAPALVQTTPRRATSRMLGPTAALLVLAVIGLVLLTWSGVRPGARDASRAPAARVVHKPPPLAEVVRTPAPEREPIPLAAQASADSHERAELPLGKTDAPTPTFAPSATNDADPARGLDAPDVKLPSAEPRASEPTEGPIPGATQSRALRVRSQSAAAVPPSQDKLVLPSPSALPFRAGVLKRTDL